MNGTTVIVFTDGSCSALETILNNVQSPSNYSWAGPVPQGSHVVKVDTVSEESGEAFVTLLVDNEDNEQSLFYYKVPSTEEEEAILTPQVSVIHLKRDNVKLLNSCVVLGHGGLVVLSIWSDKRMMRQEIREGASSNDAGQFTEMINFIKLDQPFSISSPAKNYIAVYGGNAQQEGASLMLYNIQYNLVEARQNFKVLFNNSRLWTLGTNILLATGQSLSVFPFYVAEEELLHLIGSMKHASLQEERATYVQNDMIDEGSDDQNLIEFGLHMQPATFHAHNNKRDRHPITASEFDEMVESLVTTTAVRLFEVDANEVPCSIAVNVDPTLAATLSLPLQSLVRAMESQGFSEMEITNEMIPHLINHEAERDLMTILDKYRTLSEGVTVECLLWAIRTENRQLLGRVLAIEFEEEYMIYNLRRKLTVEQVLFFVQFLYECLSGSCSSPEIADMDLTEVVLKWLTCLVDAHYTNILMSKSKQMAKQFTKWRALIEKHIEGLQQLATFSACVERMAHAKSSNVGTSSKWYNIEVISI